MVSASQIREEIARFLSNSIDLDSFEDWIVQHTWNIHLSGSKSAEELTYAIEQQLSEHSSKLITFKELRQALTNLIHAETLSVYISDTKQLTWMVRMTEPQAQPAFAFRSSAQSVLASVPVRL
jgi:hypothetical protein